MSRIRGQRDGRRLGWLKEYVLGLGAGTLCMAHGLYGVVTRSAFLPGLKEGRFLLQGTSGLDLAVGYLTGGLYLLVRFFVHPRCRTESRRSQVYMVECGLLVGFMAALVYVLLKVGSAGGLNV